MQIKLLKFIKDTTVYNIINDKNLSIHIIVLNIRKLY